MADGESNGHVTDDATWPESSKSWSQCAYLDKKSSCRACR